MSDENPSPSASEAAYHDADMQASQRDTDETVGTQSVGDADEQNSAVSLATGLHSLNSGPPRSVSTSRVDRLLLQRLKRSKSQTLLWGDAAPPPLPAPAGGVASQGSDTPGSAGGPPTASAAAPAPGLGLRKGSGALPQLRPTTATDPPERSAAGTTSASFTANLTASARAEARESPGETGASIPYVAGAAGAMDNSQQRLLVVANRLPVSAYRDKAGRWQFEVSAGGLVSALMGVHNFRANWIGWPGVYVEEGPDRDSLTAALSKEGYIPVYLDEKTVDLHYNGFCNSVLWALFHYVPLNIETKLSETRTLQFQWAAYQDANRKFAEAVFDIYREGDVVWAQDYHLMLLPAMLKKQHPKMKVGWFLHTPFPSSEIYRTLPVREEVLRAVLRADLIGFHTYDYARHFVSAGTRILGLEGTPEGVEDNGSLTRVAAFPIGIDPERFAAALEDDSVRASIAQLLNKYAGRKVMLGVDRLDMIKGIPQKLLAFEKFLEENPEWRDRVLLVQIAVPSRTDVPEYQRLRSMVHEIVGRINGRYGTLTENPIHHLDRQLSFHELCALYAVTDVALVTSLRDGMNLVSYEYVACQSENAVPGVLVLSEFAGAAQSLGAGAILVNPWNITDMAAAIEDALTMSEQERRERHRQNYMHITIHTSQTWADTFISELNDTHVEAELRTRNIPPLLDVEDVVHEYQEARRRLLVFGYNATLTTGVEQAPRQPKRHFDNLMSMARVNPQTYNSIKALTENPNTVVVIFSGSAKDQLEETFGALHVWLAAENGIFMRPPPTHYEPKPDWVPLVDVKKKEWMEAVALVFDYFRERTPRSFVEPREASIVWNYKNADIEFGRLQARDLLQHLWTGPISNAPVDIVQGSKSVEVRPVGISKGIAMQSILHAMVEQGGPPAIDFDFVLVVGHFLTRDENIFTFFEAGLIMDFGQKMLEGKAGMAAALSVMGSSAVSLPALAGLPHSGPSLQRLSEAGEGSDFGSSVLAPVGGDAPIVSPLTGAPGFVKAAAAATPAVNVPTAGPLASVAEHTNAAASARQNGELASSPGKASELAEAAAQDAVAEGPSHGNGSGLSVATAMATGPPLSSQPMDVPDGRPGPVHNQTQPPADLSSGSAGGLSSSGGSAPGPPSRYSMLAALPPGGVDRSATGGPPSLGRDSTPAALDGQGGPKLDRDSYQSLGGASAAAWTPGATPPCSVPPSPAAGSSAARAAFTSSDLPYCTPPYPAAASQRQEQQSSQQSQRSQQQPSPPQLSYSLHHHLQPPGLPPRAVSASGDASGQRGADGFATNAGYPGRSGSMPEGSERPMRRVESGLRSSSALLQGLPATPTGTNVFFNSDMDLPMKLPPEHLFSCTVGRQRSQARGFLNSSAEVGTLLAKLANRAV